MSRVGKKFISVPSKVDVNISGSLIQVKGPKGELVLQVHETMEVTKEGENLLVKPKEDDTSHSKFQGLTRSLISNMVKGVSEGFTRSLTLVGVGYRAAMKGQELHLTLGYSHPVVYQVPKGLTVAVDKQTEVVISGFDKCLVGQAAADIRSYRRPEPYHGKGIRYSDEVIVTKVGKASGKK